MDPNLLRKLQKIEEDSDGKLSLVGKLDEFSRDTREFLEYCYNSNDVYLNKMGSVFNSIFYHQRQTFLVTKSIVYTLLKNDDNVKVNTIDTKTYKRLLYKMLNEHDFLDRLREPTKKKAGVYKLVEPTLVRILHDSHGEDYFRIQEDTLLSLYDKYEDDNSKEEFTGPTLDEIERNTFKYQNKDSKHV